MDLSGILSGGVSAVTGLLSQVLGLVGDLASGILSLL
jgi:hypothetical protein